MTGERAEHVKLGYNILPRLYRIGDSSAGASREEEAFRPNAKKILIEGVKRITNAMVSEKDIFQASGPIYLSYVDWNCSHQRRSVAASLVQGTYVLERDRQQALSGELALAPPWWEFFHFNLIRTLVDDADHSIFGAIYKFNPPPSLKNPSSGSAPKVVIALRGTVKDGDSFIRDLELDMQFVWNNLHRTSRFEIAIQAVQSVVSTVGTSNVWLAGHSLGSAIATVVGQNMAKMGNLLETFLFNPPFISAPLEKIKDKTVKHGLRIAASFVTAGLSIALKAKRRSFNSEDSFAVLSSWFPNLFVNPEDHLCSEYIGYFEHRQRMEDMGIGNIEKLATQNSLGDLVLTALGKESRPLHLLPSARLAINRSHSPDFKWAHGIHQWWRPDLDLHSKEYHYR